MTPQRKLTLINYIWVVAFLLFGVTALGIVILGIHTALTLP